MPAQPTLAALSGVEDPSRIAVDDGTASLTWAELDERDMRPANGIEAAGTPPGSHLAAGIAVTISMGGTAVNHQSSKQLRPPPMHTQAQMGSGVTLETTRPRTQRQEELVQAASRLFAERGYYNVGINDISAELGLSGPALYHHYPSKEALLVDVMNTVATSQVDGMREVATSSPDPTIRLTGMIKYHVGFAFDQREYLAAWRTEFHNLPVPERRRLRQIQRLYVNEWMRAVGAIQQTADSEQLLAICHAALALMQAPTAAQNVLQRPEHEQLLCEMAYTVLTAKLPVTREHAGSRVRRT